jgi:hypothetical protein
MAVRWASLDERNRLGACIREYALRNYIEEINLLKMIQIIEQNQGELNRGD